MSLRRIVTVCSSSNWGGTEKWSLRASEQLAERGVELTFACREPELFRQHLKNVSPIGFRDFAFRNEADLGTVLALAKTFRGADAVILTRVRDYWLGGLAARLAGVPALLRLGIVRSLRGNYLMDRLRYSTLPSAALVNAEAIRGELLKTSWMRGLPIRLIYNGVETPGRPDKQTIDDVRQSYGVPDDALWLVGSGRLGVEKRWHLLVEATARLAENGVEVYTTLFGEGSERHRIEMMIRTLGMQDRILMPGYTPEASEHAGCADIMLLPSDNEGLSNTMLEAMGRGLPVVASASGGVREVFETGKELLLVDPDDNEGLFSELMSLATDAALRESISSAALERVRTDFSWTRMGDELYSLLDGMSGGGER